MMASLVPAWARTYRLEWLSQDVVAGLVVAVMLVPQSLGYAMLAGLPPQVGLYASIAPLLAYGLFGSSMTLAVGPVAVTSLMTASALAGMAAAPDQAVGLAALLALLVGLVLAAAGVLRLGFLAGLLSHPVVAGFTAGSAVLIMISQLGPLLGISARGDNTFERLTALISGIPEVQFATAGTGAVALLLLWLGRSHLPWLLQRAQVGEKAAVLASRLVPMVVVLGAAWVAAVLDAHARHGIAVVGAIPTGLPHLLMDGLPWWQAGTLLPAALAIATITYVESISVAQSLALRRRQRIDPDAELNGLGAANLASAISGGLPVAGGFARSVVNDAAGARTPLAGVVSAALMLLVLLGPAGLFETLPLSVLAATIMVAVLPLVDLHLLKKAWRYDRMDAMAFMGTGLGVLASSVESGIVVGVVFSLMTLVWRVSRPHIAVVGRVPGTEHFRNVKRHAVQTWPSVLLLRVDENLLFASAAAVDRGLRAEIDRASGLREVVLVMASVSHIDVTGIEMLSRLIADLDERGVRLMLAEVKGPVQDRLARSEIPELLNQRIFLTTQDALQAIEADAPGGAGDHS